MKLGFFVGVAIVTASTVGYAQTNTLGDRGSEIVREQKQTHKIRKQRISRKQKLLFKKPNVRHTAEFEFYKSLEQVAREKQRVARKKIQPLDIPNLTYNAEYEFYKRAELVAREKQRRLIEMAKPQYTNFAYFGHKHPPKRHLPYAMRYCKECGIRH